MKWLEDKVYSIREAATKILAQLAKEFGEGWVRDIIPKVVDMSRNPHYLYRLSILWTLHKLAAEVSRDTLCTAVLPVVMERAKDRVANVKFNVAKVLQGVVPLVDRCGSAGAALETWRVVCGDPRRQGASAGAGRTSRGPSSRASRSCSRIPTSTSSTTRSWRWRPATPPWLEAGGQAGRASQRDAPVCLNISLLF